MPGSGAGYKMGGEEKRRRQTELDGTDRLIGKSLSLRGFLAFIFVSRLDNVFSEF